LAELSQRTRDIFLLSRIELVPNRDIAVRHGISISAVEKHVIKAIAHISRKSFETTFAK
jgi:DNA-directed RNA polymerase specialized sigma24 family protein